MSEMESDSGRKGDKCDYLVRGELSAPCATAQYLIGKKSHFAANLWLIWGIIPGCHPFTRITGKDDLMRRVPSAGKQEMQHR